MRMLRGRYEDTASVEFKLYVVWNLHSVRLSLRNLTSAMPPSRPNANVPRYPTTMNPASRRRPPGLPRPVSAVLGSSTGDLCMGFSKDGLLGSFRTAWIFHDGLRFPTSSMKSTRASGLESSRVAWCPLGRSRSSRVVWKLPGWP